jgi:large subunit ribosomal protein L21
MYAVIEQGGKQYKVTEGDRLDIELTEVAPNAKKIKLENVLFVSDGDNIKIGTPHVEGAKVTASFEATAEKAVIKGKKLHPVTFRRRKGSKRRMGHRQNYLRIVIDKIKA